MKNIFKYWCCFLYIIISVNGCANGKAKAALENKKLSIKNIDLRNDVAIKRDSLQNLAKEGFGLIELSIKGDTLNLVYTSSFLYYPFGKFNTPSDFIKTNKTFKETIEHDKGDPSIKLYRMSNKNNFIKLFKDDGKSNVEIISGKVNDSELSLINGIKIGISRTDFLKIFFKDVPEKQVVGIKVIRLISGLEGIIHVYVFNNERLTSFYFNTDYSFDKN
ncbi:MAG: hypothetical protein AAB347_10225 [Bacteroidota bacterium]